jgi:glycosyltransferase involved in cell wall biosynthesis
LTTADGFSVLMPVYRGDAPRQVSGAFDSITQGQRLRPAQVVIVRDGPVGVGLQRTLDQLASQGSVEIVSLARNVGLAGALNAGLDRCQFDVVARQDADDLSRPDRFSLCVPLVQGGSFDVVAGAMAEFDAGGPRGVRSYPLDGQQIARRARMRNPIAHPTAVFRRSIVLEAGGYRPYHHLEDYDLWVRLIRSGARLRNLPDVLVDYRVSTAAFGRRGGLTTLRAEWELQREFLRTGFITRAEWLRNLVVRGGFELSPAAVRRALLPRA